MVNVSITGAQNVCYDKSAKGTRLTKLTKQMARQKELSTYFSFRGSHLTTDSAASFSTLYSRYSHALISRTPVDIRPTGKKETVAQRFFQCKCISPYTHPLHLQAATIYDGCASSILSYFVFSQISQCAITLIFRGTFAAFSQGTL